MGLMDKVKAQAVQLAQQAQDTAKEGRARLDQAQANKRADVLLRNLGAAVFADQTGRGTPQTPEQIAKLIRDISAHEAENGLNLASQPMGWQTAGATPAADPGAAAPGPAGTPGTDPAAPAPAGPPPGTDPAAPAPASPPPSPAAGPPGTDPAAPAPAGPPPSPAAEDPVPAASPPPGMFPDADPSATFPDPGAGTTFPPSSPGTTFPEQVPDAFPEAGSETFPEPSPDATFPEPGPDSTFPESDPGTSSPPRTNGS